MELNEKSKARLFEMAKELEAIAEENGLSTIDVKGGKYVFEGEKKAMHFIYLIDWNNNVEIMREEE